MLNGQKIEWAYYEQNKLCVCGHTKLAHIHFNGGLNIPDGTPTYCGFENCDCDSFTEQTLETLSTNVVNELAGLDMKYTLVSDDHDRLLGAIQRLDEFAQHEIKTLKKEMERFNCQKSHSKESE
jgi:hypothetical protein